MRYRTLCWTAGLLQVAELCSRCAATTSDTSRRGGNACPSELSRSYNQTRIGRTMQRSLMHSRCETATPGATRFPLEVRWRELLCERRPGDPCQATPLTPKGVEGPGVARDPTTDSGGV